MGTFPSLDIVNQENANTYALIVSNTIMLTMGLIVDSKSMIHYAI